MSIIERFPGATGLTLSDLLVPATMAGAKTMTRRVMNPQPQHDPRFIDDGLVLRSRNGKVTSSLRSPLALRHAPWKPGDFLYVRETHYRYGHWERTGEKTRTGKDKWAFVQDSDEVLFEAPKGTVIKRARCRLIGDIEPFWHKRLARFMPKACARIVLEVVSVRAEQLKDITRGDCMAEGCPFPNMAIGPDPRQWFADLWETIHGPGSWERDRNNWVWVIGFKRVAS